MKIPYVFFELPDECDDLQTNELVYLELDEMNDYVISFPDDRVTYDFVLKEELCHGIDCSKLINKNLFKMVTK